MSSQQGSHLREEIYEASVVKTKIRRAEETWD
jgi:hypothetical protein